MSSADSSIIELDYSVQKYAWGKPASSSLVYSLLASKANKQNNDENNDETEQNYAELWLGTHVNGPSKLHGTETLLSDYIGDSDGQLAFLLKVLSVQKALSIQAHPNRELAAKLHASRPDVYKDSNHKPEMVIALSRFEALCGFRPLNELADALGSVVPPLDELLHASSAHLVNAFVGKPSVELLRSVFGAVVRSTADVGGYVERYVDANGANDELVARLHAQYPGDIGVVVATLFLNRLELAPADSLFLAANEPHAYLSGDCVECMASSDNVVRAGLTPKLRDVDTLCTMLTYNVGVPKVSRGVTVTTTPAGSVHRSYRPPIDEFRVDVLSIEAGDALQFSSPHACLVLVECGTPTLGSPSSAASRGSAFFMSGAVGVRIASSPSQRSSIFIATLNDSIDQ
jgi:mannose-6-phosphate isomerase